MAWMMKEDTSPQILEMEGKYLRAQNIKIMVELHTVLRTHSRKVRG